MESKQTIPFAPLLVHFASSSIHTLLINVLSFPLDHNSISKCSHNTWIRFYPHCFYLTFISDFLLQFEYSPFQTNDNHHSYSFSTLSLLTIYCSLKRTPLSPLSKQSISIVLTHLNVLRSHYRSLHVIFPPHHYLVHLFTIPLSTTSHSLHFSRYPYPPPSFTFLFHVIVIHHVPFSSIHTILLDLPYHYSVYLLKVDLFRAIF